MVVKWFKTVVSMLVMVDRSWFNSCSCHRMGSVFTDRWRSCSQWWEYVFNSFLFSEGNNERKDKNVLSRARRGRNGGEVV